MNHSTPRSVLSARFGLLCIVFALLGACGPSAEELERRATATHAALNATLAGEDLAAAVRDEVTNRRGWKAMRELYGAEGATTIWVDGRGPKQNVDDLIAVVGGEPAERAEAGEEGQEAVTNPDVARLTELRDAAAKSVEDESEDMARRLADLELEASYAFLTRAIHTLEGRVDPTTLDVLWFTEGRKAEPVELLRKVQGGARPGGVLADLEPKQVAYARLLEARDRYREIVAAGGWEAVPSGAALEEGARGPAVVALRRRLAAEGDLATTAEKGAESTVFDAGLTAALKRFQQRVGIETDGKAGDDTLAALDVPAEERLRQIELNLERWRWMPGDFGGHYIVVNIPEYKLRAVRAGETELEMNVIVGKRMHETPVFSDEMRFVVFNPEWNIPESIADAEVVPKILSDPGYAAREGIEVVNDRGERLPASSVLGVRRVSTGSPDDDGGAESDRGGFFARIFGRNRDRVRSTEGVTDDAATYTGSTTLPAGYRLRQAPGKDNPLGQVKFMFPNEHNIYLHDTPGDHLFQAVDRGFSHGCIRLEKPLVLADYVLQGKGDWTPEKIRQVVASEERTEVSLPETLPVHLTYFTAWADEDGVVHFRDDIYGHDGRLAKALAEEEPLTLDLAALRGGAANGGQGPRG